MTDSSETADKRRQVWIRGLFMLLFMLFYHVAEIVGFAVVLFQFVHVLVAGRTNAQALSLGEGLAQYYKQIVRYLTFNSEDRPFPFGDWPTGPAEPSPLDPSI
ncbi:MAG: DUF4389 domain-containing protein [Alphaproteobacteria bacterium]